MKDFLHFLRNEENSQDAGGEEGNLRRMKNYYLNEHLFPSMANIVFFFEAISTYPELQDEFEQDIKDLLGIRRIGPRANNYAYVFRNLIHSIIYTKKGYKNNNFRLRLILELQRIVRQRMLNLTLGTFDNDNVARHVNEDIDRAEAWTELVAAKVDDEYDFLTPETDYFRETNVAKVDESKTEFENNREIERRKSWDKYCLKVKPPSRTLVFDVKKKLEN
jgi:hypothetical protein